MPLTEFIVRSKCVLTLEIEIYRTSAAFLTKKPSVSRHLRSLVLWRILSSYECTFSKKEIWINAIAS